MSVPASVTLCSRHYWRSRFVPRHVPNTFFRLLIWGGQENAKCKFRTGWIIIIFLRAAYICCVPRWWGQYTIAHMQSFEEKLVLNPISSFPVHSFHFHMEEGRQFCDRLISWLMCGQQLLVHKQLKNLYFMLCPLYDLLKSSPNGREQLLLYTTRHSNKTLESWRNTSERNVHQAPRLLPGKAIWQFEIGPAYAICWEWRGYDLGPPPPSLTREDVLSPRQIAVNF